MDADKSAVLVGRVSSPYGIKGWVKISSYTQPLDNILGYAPWQLRNSRTGKFVSVVNLLEGKAHGKGLVAKLSGIDDRDQADGERRLGPGWFTEARARELCVTSRARRAV